MAESDASKSFAERQLAKYGWKKGMGLGRLNDGIAEPLRVKVRADKSGIGHDAKEDFSHWWDNAYNNAVNKLTVVTAKDGCVEVKRTKDSAISAAKPNVFKSSLLYNNFCQKGTLNGATYEANISNSENESEEETPASVSASGKGLLLDMSDDQLFKLCGGATAHKGARHGIRMTAKMQRLEAMAKDDASLVAEWKRKEEESQAAKSPIAVLATMPTKLWKDRTSATKAVIAYQYNDLHSSKKKKKKNKKDRRNAEIAGIIREREDEEENEFMLFGAKRNKELSFEGANDSACEKPKKKKRKHREQLDENLLTTLENTGKEIKSCNPESENSSDNKIGDKDESLISETNCSISVNSRSVDDSQDSSNRKKKKKVKKVRTECDV